MAQSATPSEDEQQHWLRRLEATGRAQARYLWLVLVVGLFYAALRVRGTDPEQITVPIVSLKLDAATVLASGGPIVAFLVLVIMGAIRAWTHALEQYRGTSPANDAEQLDTHPNALDLAMYTTDKSPAVMRHLLSFVYPLFLTAALVESVWLGWWLWSDPVVPGREYFLVAWVVSWIPAAVLVLSNMWWKRIRQVFDRKQAG